jgi:DNA (cytosine-5)-methyltransferase 1
MKRICEEVKVKLGSLFDGIGGWQLSAIRAGIEPVWSSEIETFPLEVTKRRFPNTKQLGDVTKINGADIEPVDIITSGSPCQDLSVANGERKGLDGSRSGLFFDAIRIVRQMRMSTGGGTL